MSSPTQARPTNSIDSKRNCKRSSMRRNSLLCAVAAVVCILSALAPLARAQQRPNIVVIMTDDQAPWALGCYGNTECKTPNMDRLAREGAKFTNAFVVTP